MKKVISTAPTKLFTTPKAWRTWLEKNHSKSDGVWVRFYKKDSGKKSINYSQALDEALCFGWIDSLVNKYDTDSYIQKFTPRRSRSVWSKRNREHVARLIEEKKMTPAGLKMIESAKADGRWESAYDSPKDMKVPADFLKELKKDKKAFAFYQTLNKANLYAIAWRLQTAKKPETRERRLKTLLAMLAEGNKLH
jgi:uncharacterized protein YdeI (YjbR/CyaY-like superfamily)